MAIYERSILLNSKSQVRSQCSLKIKKEFAYYSELACIRFKVMSVRAELWWADPEHLLLF